MSKRNGIEPNSVLIIGAGPYGLAAATFLRSTGSKIFIHGEPMEAWKTKMPDRMILRSTRVASNIASPGNSLSLDNYEKQTGAQVNFQPTIGQFIQYGLWFQEWGVPEVNPTKVKVLKRELDGFAAEFEDGSLIKTERVVLATGITPYPYIPEVFNSLPDHLVSHTCQYNSYEQFRNKNVIVIGKGQSALETAAILHESGANVELITRGSQLRFINKAERHGWIGRMILMPEIHQFLYPPTDLAGPPYNWAIADPIIYRKLSKREQAKTFELVGPIGSKDLEARLATVPVTLRARVKRVYVEGNQICLNLSDGTDRVVDHVILATGFRPDIHQTKVLSEDLRSEIAQEDGFPILTLGYESINVPGLHVLGALSARSQGPINRFVCGTFPATQYLTEAVTGSKMGYPTGKINRYVLGRRFLYRMYQLTGGTRNL